MDCSINFHPHRSRIFNGPRKGLLVCYPVGMVLDLILWPTKEFNILIS